MSPWVFVVGGVVWVAVFVFVLALCAVAARADEREQSRRDGWRR